MIITTTAIVWPVPSVEYAIFGTSVPPEISLYVFSWLTIADSFKCAVVNKAWQFLLKMDNLWKSRCFSTWNDDNNIDDAVLRYLQEDAQSNSWVRPTWKQWFTFRSIFSVPLQLMPLELILSAVGYKTVCHKGTGFEYLELSMHDLQLECLPTTSRVLQKQYLTFTSPKAVIHVQVYRVQKKAPVHILLCNINIPVIFLRQKTEQINWIPVEPVEKPKNFVKAEVCLHFNQLRQHPHYEEIID